MMEAVGPGFEGRGHSWQGKYLGRGEPVCTLYWRPSLGRVSVDTTGRRGIIQEERERLALPSK